VLNRWSVAAFNELYWRRAKPGEALVDYDGYFYPLDALLEWNRIYGRAGFVQYQCVLPTAASEAGLTALLTRISQAGAGSFLSVLKMFGPQDGVLSFPMAGFTLALDFPANAKTFALLDELDAVVADHGGRLYLAKDARMGADFFQKSYPRLDEFRALRARLDPGGKFWSVQSKRLGI
jgi:FAD/FMN-containing dehydrogenase